MKRDLLTILVGVNLACLAYAVFSRSMNLPFAEVVSVAGIVVQLVFVVLALIEVHKNPDYTPTQKATWTLGLIFLGTLAGILYLMKTRRPQV